MTEKEIISKHMAELGKKAQAKRTLEQRKTKYNQFTIRTMPKNI